MLNSVEHEKSSITSGPSYFFIKKEKKETRNRMANRVDPDRTTNHIWISSDCNSFYLSLATVDVNRIWV